MELLSPDRLRETPSSIEGEKWEDEIHKRIVSSIMIQKCGILLGLPQSCICIAQTLFQKIYYRFSFHEHHCVDMAAAVTFLSCKLDESQRRLNDIIRVFHSLSVLGEDDVGPLNSNAERFLEVKLRIVELEREILKETGFNLTVEQPYSLLLSYLKILLSDVKNHTKLIQIAWNFTNDTYFTPACLFFSSEAIACTVIYISLEKLNYEWYDKIEWWRLFDVDFNDIRAVSSLLQEVYNVKNLSVNFSGSLLDRTVKSQRAIEKRSRQQDSHSEERRRDVSRKRQRHDHRREYRHGRFKR